MLFSSVTFLFIFLPVLLLLLVIFPCKLHNTILLVASIIFYAFGEPRFLPIIFSVIGTSYLGTILLSKFLRVKKLFLLLTVLIDLSFLFYFKYFDFCAQILNDILGTQFALIKVMLPLGISFYTFQAISYVVDVYRGEVKVQKNPFKFALYICLFPQLIAGPIIKYHDIEEALTSRQITFDNVVIGVKRFIIGLAKKMLIANTMGAVADAVFRQNPTAVSPEITWIGAIAYTFQIFFDFSGYSDMAIGLGRIFGFNFMENFNYPYISKSMTEFWRRWHISLSTWFKEYVYIPLGGNKNGRFKTIRNLGIVFLLTGIWHGANWNFILWGIWNGFFIILEKIVKMKDWEPKLTRFWQKGILHLYSLFIIVLGWVLFYHTDLGKGQGFIKNILFLIPRSKINEVYSIHYYIDTKEILTFIAAILCSTPLFKGILTAKSNWAKIGVNIWLLGIYFLSIMAIVVETYNPFIYFRF